MLLQRKATHWEENESFALVETGQDFFSLLPSNKHENIFCTVSLEVKGKGEGA